MQNGGRVSVSGMELYNLSIYFQCNEGTKSMINEKWDDMIAWVPEIINSVSSMNEAPGPWANQIKRHKKFSSYR